MSEPRGINKLFGTLNMNLKIEMTTAIVNLCLQGTGK